MSVVIVAIPSEQDAVWNYSSEKVPHMTLLDLGEIQDDAEALAEIFSFMQHIANTSLSRFGMSVDRRGTLGPDDADVLFFKNEHYDRQIKVARDNMLQEPHIRAAFLEADQYPEWTPHLTMGYPATPAKEDDRDYPGFGWVNFDRIALWIGDYDGPTIDLHDQYEEYSSPDSVAMSDVLSTTYAGVQLEHSGVKGMKWGVHHENRLQLLKRVANGTATRGEKLHVSLTEVSGDSVKQSGGLQKAAHNKAQELEERKTRIQKGEGTFKDRVALSGGDRLRETSGRKARKKEDSEKPSPFAKHSFAGIVLDDDILAHHGVKGMHWGVRKEESGGSGGSSGGKETVSARLKREAVERTGTDVVVRTKPGQQIQTLGGHKHDASVDAIRARTAQQIAEKSTLDALSNKDLQDLVTRMNLEQQYNRLSYNEADSRQSKGQQMVNSLVNEHGDAAVKSLATNPATAPYAIPVAIALKGYQYSGANKAYRRSQRPGVQKDRAAPEKPSFPDFNNIRGENN